jgi:hypothetical protein
MLPGIGHALKLATKMALWRISRDELKKSYALLLLMMYNTLWNDKVY